MKQRGPINRHRKPGSKTLPQRYRRLRSALDREEGDPVDMWVEHQCEIRDREGLIAEGEHEFARRRSWQQLLGAKSFGVPVLRPSLVPEPNTIASKAGDEKPEAEGSLRRSSPTELIRVLAEYNNWRHTADGLTVPWMGVEELCRRDPKTFAAFRELAKPHVGSDAHSRHGGVLLMMLELSKLWIRSVRSWSHKDPEAVDWIDSLAEHLFVDYPIPPCLRRVWNTEDYHGIHSPKVWYVLLGQGVSLRKAAASFGWEIPSRFVHWLYQAPGDLSFTEAIVWAEVMRVGGSPAEFRRVRRQQALAIDFTHRSASMASYREFLRTTVQWLAQHRDELTDPMCDVILDWRVHLLTERRPLTPPPWRGITVRRAFEEASAYARSRETPYAECSWRKRGWDGSVKDADGTEWTIQELSSGRELFEEGRALRHCVGSYANRCVVGGSAILSLRSGGERRVTVEVLPNSRNIVQARGVSNRHPTRQEQEILARWRKEALLHAKPTA